jgi:hypothetical protein
MGFEEERIKYYYLNFKFNVYLNRRVLRHFKNNFERSMDYLISNGGIDTFGDE